MATKPGSVVAYNEELPSIKSQDPLITWSTNLNFSYAIARFITQTHISLHPLLAAFAYKA